MATYSVEKGEGSNPAAHARKQWLDRELDNILNDLRDLHMVIDAGEQVQVPASAGETDPSHKSIGP